MHDLLSRVFMDFTTAYQFGLKSSSNFIENDEVSSWWLQLYKSRKRYTFWPQEMPVLTSSLARVGINLSPAWVAVANRQLEQWCLKLCDAAEVHDIAVKQGLVREDAQDVPVVYRHLKEGLERETKRVNTPSISRTIPTRLQIASEMLDQSSAGQETSAITLTFLFDELARRPKLQARLCEESSKLHPAIRCNTAPPGRAELGGAGGLPSAKEIDSLQLLNAVLMETLRLHAAIPGPQPRLSPTKLGVVLGGYENIPPNLRVSCNAHCLHRNPEAFPEPDVWKPERWLEEKGANERSCWFWAFGSGGRMCIGSNLAMQSMKLVIATIISNFKVERTEKGELFQEDAYTAYPAGKLMLRFLKQ